MPVGISYKTVRRDAGSDKAHNGADLHRNRRLVNRARRRKGKRRVGPLCVSPKRGPAAIMINTAEERASEMVRSKGSRRMRTSPWLHLGVAAARRLSLTSGEFGDGQSRIPSHPPFWS